jgi:hypothetical protein
MKNLLSALIAIIAMTLIVPLAQGAIPMPKADEDKYREVLSGHAIDCYFFKPSLSPTLYFEAIGPQAVLSGNSKQISLQMKVVYYRCHVSSDGHFSYTVVDPKSPYQYEVVQSDGSLTTIKVLSQKHQFTAVLGDNNELASSKKGLAPRRETEGLLNFVQFELTIDKVLSVRQQAMRALGNPVFLYVRVFGAFSSVYKIGSEPRLDTGFIPATTHLWSIKLSGPSDATKAELLSINTEQP